MSDKLMQCDMSKDCHATVTHIGEKGYAYCTAHAIDRRTHAGERTRKMRAWEIRLIQAGQPLPSYQPISRRQLAQDKADETARQQWATTITV